MKCLNCQTENREGAEFCKECGHPTLNLPLLLVGSTKPRSSSARAVKKVYLAHDAVPDRDVAFALIKTERLDNQAGHASPVKHRPWQGSAHIQTSSRSMTWGNIKVSGAHYLGSVKMKTIKELDASLYN